MRIAVLLYGLLSYAIGLGGLLYFILYLSAWELVPNNIVNAPLSDTATALPINTLLILLFGIQHSVMARKSFKDRITRVVSPAIERSTYVLLSGILMVVIAVFWRGFNGGYIWNISNAFIFHALCAIQMLGWLIVVLSSFLINHFELFGLQQVYYHFMQRDVPKPQFTDRFLYKLVRHPLQLGVLIGIWVTPVLTQGHLYLATTMSIYIFVGLYFEERDLLRDLGDEYRAYQSRVRKIVPIPK